MEFEPTIAVFAFANTVFALDHAATVIGIICTYSSSNIDRDQLIQDEMDTACVSHRRDEEYSEICTARRSREEENRRY
jgi:hypothetical protein